MGHKNESDLVSMEKAYIHMPSGCVRGEKKIYATNLETFIAVADAGSFTRAAEKLYISSTAVIKQINTLEAYLRSVGTMAGK